MKRALIVSAVLAFTVTASMPLNGQSKAPAASKDLVAAIVDGRPIMESDVQSFHQNLPPQFQQVPYEQIRAQLIERMIDQVVVASAAKKAGLHKRADVRRRVATITQSILNEVYMSEKIKGDVTDAKVKDQYQKSIALDSKREEVRARHILVKTRAQAMAIIAEIKRGANFAAVAKAKSTGPSSRNGGDLGYFEFKQMVPPFSKTAFALRPGEITMEPVQTQFGWHVIKVEDRRIAGSTNFEQASQKIRQKLNEKAYKDTLTGLRAKAKITILGTGSSKIQPLQ
ncbi:peptidylprolyl isomerase [Alphaproteobacteria bacterium]|nr:peptidylprolyl isomerase [Alphaproteobacteria bacterium]